MLGDGPVNVEDRQYLEALSCMLPLSLEHQPCPSAETPTPPQLDIDEGHCDRFEHVQTWSLALIRAV